MKEVKTGTYTHMVENVEETRNFNFYADLSAAKKLHFVNSVVSLLVDDIHYNSVIRNLVFDFYVIDTFTDVDTADLVNSNNFLDDVERFLNDTNIVEIVKANTTPSLFAELNDAVDKSIQYITGIHPNPLNNAIASLLNTIENKVHDVDLDSIMSMVQKFAGMTEDFTLDNMVNAYMNSDVHKKNLAEIIEFKNKSE